MSDHDERQNSPPPGDDHDHNGAMVDEGEPDVRFDIADVPRQMAAEDSHQQEDVQRALYQNNENNRDHVRKFNATRRKDVKFSRLRELLATGQHRTAMALLRCRRRLVVDDEYLVAKDDPNVVARVGPHYIDYALYVGARCGLDAVLPNFRTDHNWSAKLDLTMTNRLWPDANIKGLPFNPSGRMVYIGTRLDEQIWLAMVPNTYFLPDHLDNVPEHHPSLPAKTTSLTPGHQLMLIMFLAYILAREMHHEDIHVAHQYPNPLTRAAVAASTEILGREGEQHRRINLRPHDLHRLHDAITRCYVQWVRDAPREWKEDGFLTNNSPLGVTIRYGQNQPIGSTRTRNEEQENWHRDRYWMHMRRFTFSLATHISMLVVTEWTEISVEDILDAHENLYDKPEDHPDRRRVDLRELRLLDDDGFEIPVFNEQGFRVGRRAPREYDTCGALLDLERVHELFQGPEDVHGRAQNVGSYMMYPMAFTRTMGNVQAHSLFPVFQQRVSLIDEVVRPPVLDEDVAMDDEDDNNEVLRRGAPVLKGTGCQVYNSLSHRVRSETKFHLVQLGKITSALAGSTASTVAGKRNWTRCVNGCKNGLPHQMFAEKVSGPGQPQTMRFENTYTLDVSRMVEDLRDGGWIYGHVICPLLKAWSHQTVLAPVKDALVVFEPDIVPELFKAATYPICAMLQMLWDENVDGLTQGNVVNPCLIEFVSMLERTLNFGHTGNARVLTRGLMDRSWLSLALLHDGFPSLSEAFVAHGSLFSGSLVIRQDAWPVDAQTRRPLTSSARSQELTYGEQHYEAYLARFTIRLAMQRMSEDVYPTIPDASVKFACYAAEIALRIYMDDVKRLVNAQVSEELAPLFDSNDRHVRRSAVERQRALECWLDEDFPLSYERGVLGNLMAATTEPQGGSYSLTEANIGRKSISFLVDILLKHVQGTPRRREPPFITKGHFLPVLKIAVEEMHHIAALNHSYASKVDQFIADAITHVFEVLKINHVPWSSNPLPGARNRASSVVTSKVWLGLGGKEPPRAGQGSSLIARQHSSLALAMESSEEIQAKDPRGDWSALAVRLASFHKVLHKTVLPTEWDICHVAVSNNEEYVSDAYSYVRNAYDASNPLHHLAIICAIACAGLLPRIYSPTLDKKYPNDPGDWPAFIRDLDWVQKPRKGATLPAPFITMVAAFIICHFDKASPISIRLSQRLDISEWLKKNSAKGITSFLLCRLGLAKVISNSGFRSAQWQTHILPIPSDEIAQKHAEVVRLINTKREYAGYDAINYLMGSKTADLLASNHYVVGRALPVVSSATKRAMREWDANADERVTMGPDNRGSTSRKVSRRS